MGPGIVIPVVLVAIVVPIGFTMAKRYLKDGVALRDEDDPATTPGVRLTSNALRALPTPWRVVYEVAEEKLGGPHHVLIGPAGIFAVLTSMDPLPAPVSATDPHAVAAAAIARGGLDDALRRCAMTSDRLLTVHWGPRADGAPISVDTVPGALAVDGRELGRWADALVDEVTRDPTRRGLAPAQIDLAWQTVTVAIGRPDPLR